jgi:WD40 repeat protein
MKAIFRPKFLIAFTLGVMTALFVWLIHPQACWSAKPTQNASVIAVSSGGQFLVMSVTVPNVKEQEQTNYVVQIWDRRRSVREPWLEFSGGNAGPIASFSPDGRKLALVVTTYSKTSISEQVQLCDLGTGQSLASFELPREKKAHVFFSPEGQLLLAALQSEDEFIVRDAQSNEVRRRSPRVIDDYEFAEHRGQFGVFRKSDRFVRAYSWLTGELVASHDLVGQIMFIKWLSRDGQVIDAGGWPPGASLWSAAHMTLLHDARTGAENRTNKHTHRILSPDGQHIAELGSTKLPEWLTKFNILPAETPAVDIIDWAKDKKLATIAYAKECCFSATGNQIAVVRTDGAIDVYTFPFETPWSAIVGAGFVAAFGSWGIGWLWGRWRLKTKVGLQ